MLTPLLIIIEFYDFISLILAINTQQDTRKLYFNCAFMIIHTSR